MLLKNLFKIVSAGLAGLGIGMAFAPKEDEKIENCLDDNGGKMAENNRQNSPEKFYNITFKEAPPPKNRI